MYPPAGLLRRIAPPAGPVGSLRVVGRVLVELGKELQEMKSTYSPSPGCMAAFAVRFIQKVDDAVNSLRR